MSGRNAKLIRRCIVTSHEDVKMFKRAYSRMNWLDKTKARQWMLCNSK